MNNATVLRAYGPNEVQTIAMVFATLKDGEKFMDDIFAPYADKTSKGAIGNGIYKEEAPVPVVNKVISKDGLKIVYDVDQDILDLRTEDDDKNEIDGTYLIHEQIFNRYYDGCGGVWKYALETVECGTKLLGWDLD